MKKKLRVLMAFDTPYAVQRPHDWDPDFAEPDRYVENDVCQALRENGYEVGRVGIFDDILPLIEEIREFRPDVVFNLCEGFNDVQQMERHIAGLIELLGVPCTGAHSGAIHLCNDKALSKKILRFHRVRVPRFQTFYRGHKVWLPKTLKLPCIVKPLTEEGSRGISLASVVDDEKAFGERVRLIHESMQLDAIAEEYIDGRELYMSIMGDARLRALPPREMTFGDLPEDEPRIATYKAKWDDAYRKRWGIRENSFAQDLSPELQERLDTVCKRAYRALNIRSYARFDLRVTPAGQVYVIEANVNPNIAKDDEFGQSAAKVGIAYPALIRRIVSQALRRRD